jgi:hypothetical protein
MRQSGFIMSGKIDDPIDASFEAFPEEPVGVGGKFTDLALSFSGLVFPPAAVVKILIEQFQTAKRFSRVDSLLQALKAGLSTLESRIGSDREKMKAVQAQIESPRFQEAVATACEASARTVDTKKVQRMAEILAGSLTPTRWSPKDEDVATLIRDIAQLSDRDIEVLAGLSLAFGGLMISHPKLPAKIFTDNNSGLDRMVEKESDPDEFYSTCGRLIGFGLAVEVTWPTNHVQPHERCIRPTRRGLALLGYFKMFAS